jgi:glycosyltransferase involved in cell wall biosynthesis
MLTSTSKTVTGQRITYTAKGESWLLAVSTATRSVRPWSVAHACNLAREVTDVVDAQLHVGMRPYLLTLDDQRSIKGSNPVSLLQGWQDVRRWRKQFDENGTYFHLQLIHSHSFAAGMAAVRGSEAVVYDARQWIEDRSPGASSWLARSFRTAEQFALSRSSAVVVHSQAMRSECLSRGVSPEDVFVVPDPVSKIEGECPSGAGSFGVDAGSARYGTVSVVARVDSEKEGMGANKQDEKSGLSLQNLLLAFAQALRENDAIKLILIAPNDLLLSISQKARELEIRERVILTSEEDKDAALASADVVIGDPVCIGGVRGLAGASMALAGLSKGKAVLAADNSENRELSPNGRGLLWFSAEQKSVVRDLGHRLAFLARNADFRRALGDGGQRYILQERSPERIGGLYDEVYRHAYARRHKGDSSQSLSAALIPMQSSI